MNAILSRSSHRSAASLLDDAVADLSRQEPSRLDCILGRARQDGVLVGQSGFFFPSEAQIRRFAAKSTEFFEDWIARGFCPFFVKEHQLGATQRAKLDRIFVKLRDARLKGVPPHWITPRYIVSFYLPDSFNLCVRDSLHIPTTSVLIHDICTEFLGRFIEAEQLLRSCIEPEGVECFPIRSRYLDSVAILSKYLGEAAVVGLDSIVDPSGLPSRSSLFFDSKPANVIAKQGTQLENWQLDGRSLYRIDLDMMFFEIPLCLELVLIFFSYPVAYENHGSFASRFSHLFNRISDLVHILDAGNKDEVITLIWYHFVRNFASSLESSNHAKAVEMGHLLVSAAPYVGLTCSSPLVQSLMFWLGVRGEECFWSAV